jgi:hypothetical protein
MGWMRSWTVATLMLAGLFAEGPARAAPVAFTGTIELTGGLGATWRVTDDNGTDTGSILGLCSGAPGLGIGDAEFVPGVAVEDAFDGGLTVWVDDSIFVSPETVDVTGQTLTSGPVTMSGLQVTVQYHALATAPILRTLVTFENPGSTPIAAVAHVVTNVGSDGSTGIRGSANGNASFELDDTWVVTSDSAVSPTDAVNVHVVGGPLNPPGAPFGYGPMRFGTAATTVFSCGGTEGIQKRYDLQVPPRTTLALLLFNRLASTVADGIAGAEGFNANPSAASELLSGLGSEQLVAIMNWSFFGEVNLVGGGPGGGTSWQIWNFAGTSTGTATTGVCEAAPGLSVVDAVLDPGGPAEHDDAFDNGLVLYVDDAVFVSQLSPAVTSSSLTAGPRRMSGLDVSVQYLALEDAPTLRTLATFANPGAAPITATVRMASNFGSDLTTAVRATSSGDTAASTADRWVVTSDDATTPTDAVNTSVLAGPGNPPLPPSLVSTAAFTCVTTAGLVAEYRVTVPPGETRSLLFFNDLHATNDAAISAATTYDTTPAAGGPLLTGLDATTLSGVLNWALCASDVSLCADADACTLDGCAAAGGCTHDDLPSTATFISVGCRLADLQASALAGVPAGALQSALVAKLEAARMNAVKAENFRAAGKRRAAKRAIAKAIKALRGLERKLRSRPASGVDAGLRAALQAGSSALRTDLRTLKNGP